MSPSPPSPGLLRTHGARATEEVLFDLLGEATVVDGDPAARAAALARSVRVVVPSTSLRHHVSAELVRRHGAVAGVQVQSLYAVAREILERGGPGAEGESPGRDRPGDLPFEILVRRLARQETALARGLDFLVDGYGAVAATVRDLLDAGLEPIHADAAEEALEATLGDESRVYSTRAEVDRARALVRVAARVGAGLGSLGVVRHSALFARAADRLAVGVDDTAGQDGECAPVSLVTGPGNIYVAAAKRLLKGLIGIDAEAGPTEIAVLADATADPEHVAADLISQAEHDPLAGSVLVTDSTELADAVAAVVERRAAATKHSERVAEALGGRQSAIVLVDDLDAGLRVVDAYAAEHLEVITADASAVAARVRNAGAIFVGPHSPVSLGDYVAGSNHVLPTGGSAAHSSGLSVQSFLRGIHVIEYSADALAEIASHVVALAEAEDLPAHGEAVTARTGEVRR